MLRAIVGSVCIGVCCRTLIHNPGESLIATVTLGILWFLLVRPLNTRDK